MQMNYLVYVLRWQLSWKGNEK